MNLFFKTVCLPFWLTFWNFLVIRGASRTATTSKMELFVIIVNGWKHDDVMFWHFIKTQAIYEKVVKAKS